MSCLSSAAFLSCSVSAVPLACRVSRTYSPSGMLYSTATMTIPFKLTDYQRSFFFQCLTPCLVSLPPRFYHAASPFYCLSFLSCLSHNILLLVCYTVLQQFLLKFTDYLTQLLLSVSHSMSCLSPDVPLTYSVSLLLSPPTIVSLAHYSPSDVFYSPETMTTPFKFTVYLT